MLRELECLARLAYLVLVNAKSGMVRDKGASSFKSELEQAFSTTTPRPKSAFSTRAIRKKK